MLCTSTMLMMIVNSSFRKKEDLLICTPAIKFLLTEFCQLYCDIA